MQDQQLDPRHGRLGPGQSRIIHPQREHVVIGNEMRSCEKHGEYASKCWDLQPKPAGYVTQRERGRRAAIRGEHVSHGLHTFLDAFWSSCPTCDAEKQREVDAWHAQVHGGMNAVKAASMERLRRSGIPSRYSEATIWNWQHPMDAQRRVWNVVREYVSHYELAIETGRCLVLLGATGTGKTHLACGLLRHVIEKGGTGQYTTVMDMLGRIKATFAGKGETETNVMDELTKCDLLVIDEVGRSLDSNYEVAQFFRVLDKRYQWQKPTVLATNLTQPKLREFLGEAVVDRLREAGGALLSFDWASQRSAKKITKTGDEETDK
jgi:DNA replication protein DnaC